MIKKKRLGIFITISVLLLVFSVTMQSSKIADSVPPPEVLSVTHLPGVVGYQTNLTVTVTFDYDINVTGVQIQYCQLDPAFTCHFPKIDMVRLGNYFWSGSFIVKEESGIIGYKIYVYLQTGSFIAPNASDYLGYDNIVEPAADEFYFSVELSTATNSLPMNFGIPCIALTFGAFVLLKRRLRK
jgi:hypothetical protein